MKRMFWLSLLAFLALAGCSVGPDHVAPTVPAPASGPFMGAAQPIYSTADADAHWWRLYQDPALDRLVEQALVHNSDLRAATANLTRVRAVLREVRGGRLPTTAVGAGATYGRAEQGTTSAGDRTGGRFDAGLDVAYEADFFGRIGRSIEAAQADVAAAEADRDSVRVMVAAETARAYADAAAAAEQAEIAEQSVALIDRTLSLTQRRFEAGLGTRLDVARVTSLRERQRATIPPLRAARDAALLRLSTLTGQPPTTLDPIAKQRTKILRLDKVIPVGDGRGLLSRRPDIRSAERQLAAQTARVGVATADLYPRISFGASLGATAPSLADLFTGGALRWLAGPLLDWSFPNQTIARARIEQAEATAAEALATFDGTVLRALQEVETALSAYAHELDRLQALQEARDEAGAAAKVTRAQLREGKADALAVLDSERSLAEIDAELASSTARITTLQVDLFRALGGGWQEVGAPS